MIPRNCVCSFTTVNAYGSESFSRTNRSRKLPFVTLTINPNTHVNLTLTHNPNSNNKLWSTTYPDRTYTRVLGDCSHHGLLSPKVAWRLEYAAAPTPIHVLSAE